MTLLAGIINIKEYYDIIFVIALDLEIKSWKLNIKYL